MDHKSEYVNLLAHKGELYGQLQAIKKALRDLDVLIAHLRAKAEAEASASAQEPANGG